MTKCTKREKGKGLYYSVFCYSNKIPDGNEEKVYLVHGAGGSIAGISSVLVRYSGPINTMAEVSAGARYYQSQEVKK